MNYSAITKSKQAIEKDIYCRNIRNVFEVLQKTIHNNDVQQFNTELENQKETYENLLKYSFEYGTDPQRDTIFANLCKQLLELNDRVHCTIQQKNKLSIPQLIAGNYAGLEHYDKHDKIALIEELVSERDVQSLISETGSEVENSMEPTQVEIGLEKVFGILAFANEYHEGEMQMVRLAFNSAAITNQDKSLIISAIFISLNLNFQEKKCNLLFEIFEQDKEFISERALLVIVIILLMYEQRLAFYPDILKRLDVHKNPEQLSAQIERIVIQYLKARDTDRISKKIQEEIIPEVMKMKDDLVDKLKLDDLMKQKDFEDKNPDWKDFFGDSSDAYKKFEEFSMMQLEGNDVFMSAFSMLKNFPFFQKISNWFLLFYAGHSDIQSSLQRLGNPEKYQSFIKGIESSSILCNSDKFSFCFNIQFIPELQQNMMIDMFNMELKAMEEIEGEEKKHLVKNKENIIYTQNLQDLYRFFKLHPLKNYFTDIFLLPVNLRNSKVLAALLSPRSIRKFGEFYFSKDYFLEAIEIFEGITNKKPTQELLEKIAFCYQKTEQYHKAVNYYKQAEIFDTRKIWLLKKMAYCLRKLGKIPEAIEYYHKINELEPNVFDNQIYLGNLFLENMEYEKALKYYFKVEYSHPKNVKVLRPIGWCYFVSGNPQKAITYFEKVTHEKSATKNDYLNLGHAQWANGQMADMLNSYRKAFQLANYDSSWIKKVFNADSLHLLHYQISDLDISLIVEYIAITA